MDDEKITGKDMPEAKSRGRIRNIFIKEKKLFTKEKKLEKVEEPVLILMRRDRQASIYEGVTDGQFNYKHSEGSDRFLILTKAGLNQLQYGDDTLQVYLCHEDYPLPLPLALNEDITTEQLTVWDEKRAHEFSQLKKSRSKEREQLIWTIMKVIGALAAGYVIIMFVADLVGVTFPWQQTGQAVVDAGINITNLTRTVIG